MSELPSSPLWGRVWALVRLRPAWPVPGCLLLLSILPWLSDAAWRPEFTTRRTLSDAELALAITGTGTVAYWLLLLLERLGLLHTGRSLGMREPSEAERRIVAAGARFLCLAMVYAGPLLLLRARR